MNEYVNVGLGLIHLKLPFWYFLIGSMQELGHSNLLARVSLFTFYHEIVGKLLIMNICCISLTIVNLML